MQQQSRKKCKIEKQEQHNILLSNTFTVEFEIGKQQEGSGKVSLLLVAKVVLCYNLPFHATVQVDHFHINCLLIANLALISVWNEMNSTFSFLKINSRSFSCILLQPLRLWKARQSPVCLLWRPQTHLCLHWQCWSCVPRLRTLHSVSEFNSFS